MPTRKNKSRSKAAYIFQRFALEVQGGLGSLGFFGRIILDESCEYRLAIPAQLHSSGKDIDILVRLTRLPTTPAFNLDDEELRMNLHEDSFGFDYLGTTHVGANGQTLADKPIQRFANVADDVCLLFEIQFLPLLSSCQINTENAIFDYTTIVN